MTAVRIPPVLRAQAGNQKQVEVVGTTVGEVLDALIGAVPGLRDQLLDRGRQRSTASSTSTSTAATCATSRSWRRRSATHDTVILLPAMAGGR